MPEFRSRDRQFTKLVDRYSRYLESPVVRLRFLNGALAGKGVSRPLSWIPFLGLLLDRGWISRELVKFLPTGQPLPKEILWSLRLYQFRFGIYGAAVALFMAVCAGGLHLITGLTPTLSLAAEALSPGDRSTPSLSTPGEEKPDGWEPDSGRVPIVPPSADLPLDRVWLVERGPGYEFYSNGTRVLTQLETKGKARRFYRFSLQGLRDGLERFEILSSPVGIVFHLSEGDLVPFSKSFNDSLLFRSKNLLHYATEKQLYNYLIDRFGRIHRIVPDELVSSHAGNSLWSDGNHAYVNLNASFIGICFEGKSLPGNTLGPDGINEAQLLAARSLTAVLRSKYQIADANCVTHGLVSLNPTRELMGYHTDLVTGFPFQALGLSDKNSMELFAVSLFGFGYDAGYVVAAGGTKWPGLELADQVVTGTARQGSTHVTRQRRLKLDMYRRALLLQKALDTIGTDEQE